MFLLLGLSGIFIQGVVLKIFNDRCGERYVVLIAFLFGALNNVIYAMASNKATIYVAVVVGSFVGMSFPTISAIKSNNVVSTLSLNAVQFETYADALTRTMLTFS